MTGVQTCALPISSSKDAATVFTQARFTALPKKGMLILNNANYVVGNFVLPNGFNYDDVVQNMAEVGVKPSIIFYSNQNDYAGVKEIRDALKLANVSVLDFIVTNSAGTGVQGYYESYADEGKLWETQEEYGTNSISPDIQPSAIQRGKMTVRGQEVEVKPLPEGTEVVNGFYSPIEKNLRETKAEKQSANKWLTSGLIGKGDEAVYTGVKGWLEAKNPQEQVSKQDILDFMKNNRIQLVEVVKGKIEGKEVDNSQRLSDIESELNAEGYSLELDMGGEGYMLIDEDGELVDYEEMPERIQSLHTEYNERADSNFNQYHNEALVRGDNTKFHQYQLEGEKSNYKEVLVTLPSRVRFADKWAFYQSKGYNKEQFDKLSDEKKQDLFIEFRAEDKKQRESSVSDFKSPHFEEPNILVHLRMNTRTDADGNKVLFLEEVQSDFQQGYRKQQSIIDDYIDKNSAKVIEAFKKKGILEVICP